MMLLLAHAGVSTLWVSSTQLLQTTIPNWVQGRVVSVELAGFTLFACLSSLGAATLVGREIISLSATTRVLAVLALAAGWAWAMRSLGPALDRARQI